MPSNDELWGTFAVDDHLRDRAFVAEVVLYDRLVIPHPPEGDKGQYLDWVKADWQPKRLKKIIDTLEEFVIPVPWTEDLRATWEEDYAALPPEQRVAMRMNLGTSAGSDAKSIRRAPADLPSRHVTRDVLVGKIKNAFSEQEDEVLFRKIKALDIDPTADIETVVGYGSYAKFKEEVPVDEKHAPISAEQDAALLFSWDFLVPETSTLTDLTLLRRAVKLSRNSEFRESRRAFHDWRRKLISKEVSVETARAEMDRCLTVYNGVVGKAQSRSRVLTALQVIAATVPLAEFILPGLGIAGGAAFGAGALLWEKEVPKPQAGSREKIAALVHDSRAAFGWHSR